LNKPQGGLFIVSAPSGGGKTSLTRAAVKRLAELGIQATISVSYTTRPPRHGEQHGVHYHFLSHAQFEAMAGRGEFLEHAEVFGHRYGTGRAATQALLDQDQDVILDIDWQGGRQVREKMPEAISIFILPPSRAHLEERLRARQQDDDAVIARRMEQAREEMSHYREYDYLIINDRFERALNELVALLLVTRRLSRTAQEQRHKSLIQKLLE
jgi:guanylate kinase